MSYVHNHLGVERTVFDYNDVKDISLESKNFYYLFSHSKKEVF